MTLTPLSGGTPIAIPAIIDYDSEVPGNLEVGAVQYKGDTYDSCKKSTFPVTKCTFKQTSVPSGFYVFDIECKTAESESLSLTGDGDTLLEIADDILTEAKKIPQKLNAVPVFYCSLQKTDSPYNGISENFPASWKNVLKIANAYESVSVKIKCDSVPALNLYDIPKKDVEILVKDGSGYKSFFTMNGNHHRIVMHGNYGNLNLTGKDNDISVTIFNLNGTNLFIDNVYATLETKAFSSEPAPTEVKLNEITFKNGSQINAKNAAVKALTSEVKLKFEEDPSLFYTAQNPFIRSYGSSVLSSVFKVEKAGYAVKSDKSKTSCFVIRDPNAEGVGDVPSFNLKIGEKTLGGNASNSAEVPYKDEDVSLNVTASYTEKYRATWLFGDEFIGQSENAYTSVKLNLKDWKSFLDSEKNTLICILQDKENGDFRVEKGYFKPVPYLENGMLPEVRVTYSGSKKLDNPAVSFESGEDLKDFVIDGNSYDLYVLTYKGSKGHIYKYLCKYDGSYSKDDDFKINCEKILQNLAVNKDYIVALTSDFSVVAYKKDGKSPEKSVNISSLNFNSAYDTVTKIYLDDKARFFAAFSTSDSSYTTYTPQLVYGKVKDTGGTLKVDLVKTHELNSMENLGNVVKKGDDSTALTDIYVRNDKIYVIAKNHFNGKDASNYAGTSNGAIIRLNIKDDKLESDKTFYASQNNPHYGHTAQPASEEKRRSAFYGPSRFVAITKDALFIADEGGYVVGLGESYKDVNRIVKISLAPLSFEVIDNNCASSFSDKFEKGSDTVVVSGNTVHCGKFSSM